MKNISLLKSSVIRTVICSLELIILVFFSIITLSNDGENEWGYWGTVLIVFGILSPIIIYVIASAVFNFFNMRLVVKQRHTPESIKKYYKYSKIYLISGTLVGLAYGFALAPIFFLENIFLFLDYKKELDALPPQVLPETAAKKETSFENSSNSCRTYRFTSDHIRPDILP